MDVKLPNGKIIKGVPDGTPKKMIQEKAISSGLATAQDFGVTPEDSLVNETALTKSASVDDPDFFGASVIEPALTIGSSIVAEPLAGIAGLIGSALPGEEGQGADFVKQTSEALTYKPKTQSGMEGLQAVGSAVQKGVDAANYPISGLAGLGELAAGQGLDQAVETIENVQNQGVSRTLGERIFEETDSPLAATIAYSAPTALLEYFGVKGAKASKVPVSDDAIKTAKETVQKGFQKKGFRSTYEHGLDATQKEKQLIKAITEGNKEKVSAMIDADPEIAKAMQDLGLKETGLPSAQSKNIQYRETEQALKKIPGSKLAKIEDDAITELQNKADSLIQEYGGRLDKSELSFDLSKRSEVAIDDLFNKAELAYDDIGKNIPKTTGARLDSTSELIQGELSDLGGNADLLSPLEKKLLDLSENPDVTYGAIDRIRKQVGEAIGKQSDVFKSESLGTLKRLYRSLTDDQEIVASNAGFSDQWSAAKKLVQKRKLLEENAVTMFGKNLSDSFMPKIGAATKNLSKGEYKKFFELINSVPKKQRQEVVISALNDAFTLGSRKEKSLSIAGFTDWHNGLTRNKQLKSTLYKYLPPELSRSLDDLARVTNGIREAQAAAPIGGQIMAAQGVFDKVTNGFAKKVLTRLPGMIGDVVDVGLERSKTKGAQNAIDLVSDPDFVRSLKVLAKGQADKAAKIEKSLMRKQKFQNFVKTLPVKEGRQLRNLGLIGWLMKEDEETTEEPEK